MWLQDFRYEGCSESSQTVGATFLWSEMMIGHAFVCCGCWQFSVPCLNSFAVFYCLPRYCCHILLPTWILLLFSIPCLDSFAVFYCLAEYRCCFLLPSWILLLFSIPCLDSFAVFYCLAEYCCCFLLTSWILLFFSLQPQCVWLLDKEKYLI